MPTSPQSITLLAIAIACILASYLLRYKMSQRVNQQPAQDPKLAPFLWTSGQVRQLHAAYRRFYPASKLTTLDFCIKIAGFAFFLAWVWITRRH
jgi:hypothetical protein